MTDACDFIEQRMRDKGIVPDRVTMHQDPSRFQDIITVVKRIGGEEMAAQMSVNSDELQQKYLGRKADHLVQSIRDEMVDEIGVSSDHRRRMNICPYDGGWAQCLFCGTEVELDPVGPSFVELGELSTPSPMPRDRQRFTQELGEEQRVILKCYLAGLLRSQCDNDCPNFKYAPDEQLYTKRKV